MIVRPALTPMQVLSLKKKLQSRRPCAKADKQHPGSERVIRLLAQRGSMSHHITSGHVCHTISLMHGQLALECVVTQLYNWQQCRLILNVERTVNGSQTIRDDA